MSQYVVIKHNRYGIELVLNSEISFKELLSAIIEKFKASSDFFRDAKLAISFKGRELSEKEMLAIVDAITENTSIQIITIMDSNPTLEDAMKERLQSYNEQLIASVQAQNCNQPIMVETEHVQYIGEQSIVSDFYIGTLRSGQVLECASSVTLVGDVNPGAKIVSEGNIVILGALKGNAHAGVAGNDNSFIFALDMNPIQLQVGQYYAKSPDKAEVEVKKRFGRKVKETTEGYNPTIATAREGNIYIEPMKKGCLDSL